MVIDSEVRLVHPDARSIDYAKDRCPPLHRDVYSHPEASNAFQLWSHEALIQAMDSADVTNAVVSGLAWMDPEAQRLNNNYVKEALSKHAGKLKGLFTPDVSEISAAVSAIHEVDSDLYVGLEFIPKWQGIRIDDPVLDPLMEAARKRGFLIKIYTCHPTQSLDGDVPYRTLQFLKRNPDITVVVPHLGGLLALFALYPPIAMHLQKAHFITSVSATMKMVKFAADVNPDNLLYGSDFPFNHCFSMLDPIKELKTLGLPPEHEEKIASLNAKRLFGF